MFFKHAVSKRLFYKNCNNFFLIYVINCRFTKTYCLLYFCSQILFPYSCKKLFFYFKMCIDVIKCYIIFDISRMTNFITLKKLS